MVHFGTSALIVAALSISDAMAGPTHAHRHQRAHRQRDVDWNAIDYKTIDYSKLDVNWASAYAAGEASKTAVAAASTPAPTAAPAAALAAVPAAMGSVVADVGSKVSSAVASMASAVTSSGSSAGLLNGIIGASNHRTSFGRLSTKAYAVGDAAINNVGVPYGANVIKVASKDGYDFTNTFTNTQKAPITVNVWNKVGEDGQPFSGITDAPAKTTLTFVLAPGASQIVAFQENSQVAWAEATTELGPGGGFAQSQGEANFLTKGSGYNLSAIPNPAGNVYDMAISSVEAPACTSDMTQNYWLTATEPIGNSDGSCFIAQSTAHLTTVMAGSV